MVKFRYILPASTLLAALFVLVGCDIEGTEKEPSGSIAVTALDETVNPPVELTGGTIYLDGNARSETTPDTLRNVALGNHTVSVKVSGYEQNEMDVDVNEGEISIAQLSLIPAEVGLLEVTSTPSDALIIIDQISQTETTPFSFSNIEVGQREVSVFLDGYRTIEGLLTPMVIGPGTLVNVDFTLIQGTLGNDESEIAYDFTLEDDFGNMISLHNYRGHVVLLTFFFKDCVNCILEFPEIEQAYQDYASYGVQVLGIDPMWLDELEDVQFVREEVGLSFKLLLDIVDGQKSTVSAQYNIYLAPVNIIIDQSGEIVVRDTDGVDYDFLADTFNELLGL